MPLGPDVRATDSPDATGGTDTAIYSESSLLSLNRDSSGRVASPATTTAFTEASSVAAVTSGLSSFTASTVCTLAKGMPPAVLLPFTLEKTIYLRKKNSYLGT